MVLNHGIEIVAVILFFTYLSRGQERFRYLRKFQSYFDKSEQIKAAWKDYVSCSNQSLAEMYNSVFDFLCKIWIRQEE